MLLLFKGTCMISALRKQFAVYYLLPTFPAVIISAIFLFFLCKNFDPGVITGTKQVWGLVGTTVGMFFAVYALYIGISYISLKRSVIPY